MRAKYGFPTLTFLVIANMIGAGVFTTSGFALADLGSPGLVLWAWAIGGCIAMAGAFSYGMLSRAMPQSGGEYLFLSRRVHPLAGFIAGWISLIAGFSGAIAFAAVAMEEYFVGLLARRNPLVAGLEGFWAIATILVAGMIHAMVPRGGARLQNVVVVLKLILLLVILGFAGMHLFGVAVDPAVEKIPAAVDLFEADPWPPTAFASSWQLVTAMAGSLVWISLSYSGFNAAVYVAGETRDPDRVVPRSLVVGTVLVTFLYLFLNAVFVLAPPRDAVLGQPDVAAIAAGTIGGRPFDLFVRATIIVCLLTSVLSMMMAAPRVLAKMADDGMMPSVLRFQGDRPLAATLTQMTIAIAMVLLSDLRGLLSYLGLTLSITAAFSVSTLWLPSIRRGPLWHPRYVPSIIYVAGTLLSATLLTINDPFQMLGTVVTLASGAALYPLTKPTIQANDGAPSD